MEWFIKAFIRASLIWFLLGIMLGVALAIHSPWLIYRPAHAHMNVVGFLTMLVFGVGYQLLPRLFGHGLYSTRLAVAHLICANVGLAGLIVGFLLRPHHLQSGQWGIAGGGMLFALGALFWVYNLWRTFDAADARHRERASSAQNRLPTLGE